MVQNARARMDAALLRWEELLVEYRAAAAGQTEISRREMAELRKSMQQAGEQFRQSLRDWKNTWQSLPAAC
jgi:hypothetical protein